MSFNDIAHRIKKRPGLGPFLGAVAAWTLLWTVLGVGDVLHQTAVGQGSVGASLDAHEIMEVLFVAAYTGIRWAAGVVILVGGGLAVRLGTRQASRAHR
jgi:hypothetical protein